MANGTDGRTSNFFMIDNAVVDQLGGELGPMGGWLYVVIVRHINRQTGVAFPSVRTLAEKCGMTKQSVRKHMLRLEELGLIAVERRQNADGSYRANLYRLVDLAADEVSNDTAQVVGNEIAHPGQEATNPVNLVTQVGNEITQGVGNETGKGVGNEVVHKKTKDQQNESLEQNEPENGAPPLAGAPASDDAPATLAEQVAAFDPDTADWTAVYVTSTAGALNMAALWEAERLERRHVAAILAQERARPEDDQRRDAIGRATYWLRCLDQGEAMRQRDGLIEAHYAHQRSALGVEHLPINWGKERPFALRLAERGYDASRIEAFADDVRRHDSRGYWSGDQDGVPKPIELSYVDKYIEAWEARQKGHSNGAGQRSDGGAGSGGAAGAGQTLTEQLYPDWHAQLRQLDNPDNPRRQLKSQSA